MLDHKTNQRTHRIQSESESESGEDSEKSLHRKSRYVIDGLGVNESLTARIIKHGMAACRCSYMQRYSHQLVDKCAQLLYVSPFK